MSIVNAREIMVEAAKGKYAIGAFNITDLIELEGVVDAAVEKKSPLIIQTSVKPSKFLGRDVLNGAGQTGSSIISDGWGSGATALNAGDIITFRGTAPMWNTAKAARIQGTPTS